MALLVVQPLPPGQQRRSEPLERGERRADVVGCPGDDSGQGIRTLPRRSPPTLPSRLEEDEGGGRRQVERLGPSGDRDADRGVGERPGLAGQPPGLVPEQHRNRIRQVCGEQGLLAVRGRRQDGEPSSAELLDRFLDVHAPDHRHVEE